MTQNAQGPVAAHVLERYQSEFYSQTDLVYRFGLMITQSKEGAERLTETTFSHLVDDFEKLKSNVNPERHLMGLAWQAWLSMRGEKFHPWNTPLMTSMSKLSLDERVVLFLIDMVGYPPEEAGQLMSMAEKDVRIALANGRKKIVSGAVEV